MIRIFVSGLINLETTLKVDQFPIAYTPARYPFFEVQSRISGVGFNVAKALVTLGSEVRFASLIGQDEAGMLVREALRAAGIPGEYVRDQLAQTPQSVILFDGEGQRQINVDLKDVQEQPYPLADYERAIEGCALAALCNVNFSRPFLRRAHKAALPLRRMSMHYPISMIPIMKIS